MKLIFDFIQMFPLWFQMALIGVTFFILLLVVVNILFKDVSLGKLKIVSSERKQVRRQRRK